MPSEPIQTFLSAAAPRWAQTGSAAPAGRVIAHLRDPKGTDHTAHANLAQEIAFLSQPRAQTPLFVSYYTKDTPYEALADRLRASLDALGLPHRIEPIATRGSWVANTGLKAGFIEEMWQDSDGPICWIDADAELLRAPYMVYDNPFDFAIVRRHGWYDISSFVYFGKSPAAGQLIADWAQLCRDTPHVWDQALLTLAWYRTARDNALASLWLNDGIFRFPRPWVRDLRDQLLYYPFKRKIQPYVSQKQASRELKTFMDASKRDTTELGSDDICPAFRTALQSGRFDLADSLDAMFSRAPSENA